MVFKLNEAAGGVKHMFLFWRRVLLRHARDQYLPQFPSGTQTARKPDGSPILCRHCGYVKVAVPMSADWTLETCSAMPVVLVNSAEFNTWRQTVPAEKLPTAHR